VDASKGFKVTFARKGVGSRQLPLCPGRVRLLVRHKNEGGIPIFMHASRRIRAQGSTEYLVILGAVLMVSLVVVQASSALPSTGSTVKEQQSQAYWASAAPFSIVAYNLTQGLINLQLRNTQTSVLQLTAIDVQDSAGNTYSAYSSAIIFASGQELAVSNQSFTFGNPCTGKTAGQSYEFAKVVFTYNDGSVTGVKQTGVKPLVARCSTMVSPKIAYTIAVGGSPKKISLSPDGSLAYVTQSGSAIVAVINTATKTVVANITFSSRPYDVAFTPDGAYAYFTNFASNTVSVINTSSNTVAATIPVGNWPNGVAVAPNGDYAYVANQLDGKVSVISTSTNSILRNISVGSMPSEIAFAPSGAYAYVISSGSSLVAINTATNSTSGTYAIPNNAQRLAVTPDGAYVYISYQYPANDAIAVFSTATNAVVKNITITGSYPMGLAITPSGSYAYVASAWHDRVYLISTANNSIAYYLPISGVDIEDVAFSPEATFAYASCNGAGKVFVIDTGSYK